MQRGQKKPYTIHHKAYTHNSRPCCGIILLSLVTMARISVSILCGECGDVPWTSVWRRHSPQPRPSRRGGSGPRRRSCCGGCGGRGAATATAARPSGTASWTVALPEEQEQGLYEGTSLLRSLAIEWNGKAYSMHHRGPSS